jgi:hypothetical protein
MDLGKLTFLCINFLFISAVGVLVFWVFMRVHYTGRRRPRIYSQPPMGSGSFLGQRPDRARGGAASSESGSGGGRVANGGHEVAYERR